jgi:putative transposase
LPAVTIIRKNILISDSKLIDKDKWQKDIPYDTRELAIRRLYKSYKTSFALLKTQNIKNFNINFKKKKDVIQSFEVNKNAITITKKGDFRIFKTRLTDNIRVRKRDREKIKKIQITKPYTNTIIKKEYDKWYICLSVPQTKNKKTFEEPILSSVFLDPGERRFQNFYSPDGICGYLGNDFNKSKIKNIREEYEKNQQILGNKFINIKKKHLRKRCGKLITKVKNIVLDMHNQAANFLTTTFKSIFIPIFETKKMVNKTRRNIDKKTVKGLLTLSHYKFREKLKNMCKVRGINFKIITEEYTSKVCGKCGNYNKDLGGDKVYNCNKCNIIIDRDLNAARNICIKSIQI